MYGYTVSEPSLPPSLLPPLLNLPHLPISTISKSKYEDSKDISHYSLHHFYYLWTLVPFLLSYQKAPLYHRGKTRQDKQAIILEKAFGHRIHSTNRAAASGGTEVAGSRKQHEKLDVDIVFSGLADTLLIHGGYIPLSTKVLSVISVKILSCHIHLFLSWRSFSVKRFG